MLKFSVIIRTIIGSLNKLPFLVQVFIYSLHSCIMHSYLSAYTELKQIEGFLGILSFGWLASTVNMITEVKLAVQSVKFVVNFFGNRFETNFLLSNFIHSSVVLFELMPFVLFYSFVFLFSYVQLFFTVFILLTTTLWWVFGFHFMNLMA